MKISGFKWIGILCLAVFMSLVHPLNDWVDYVESVLFWFGITFYVNGTIDEREGR